MAARTIRLTLAYDGTRYVGWQRQAEGASIQGLIEEALEPIENRRVVVTGAGRTDAGVHALAQVASCELEHPIPPDALVRALNSRLPADVRVLSAQQAPPAFHARYSARSKTYRYRLLNGPLEDPLERAYSWHVAERLDVAAMVDAVRRFEGRHDFAAFQASGSSTQTTLRTVLRASASVAPHRLGGTVPTGGVWIIFEVEGDGFLRHMVRAIVGTVVEVGRGRRSPGHVDGLFEGGERQQAGPTAPAQGLFLVRVSYDTDPLGLVSSRDR